MPRQSNKVSITQEQKEILLGILIGDAHMELAPNGKSARLKIEQQSKKRDYVEHLHQIFESWSPGDIALASNSNNLRFSTRYSPSLTFYHTSFYGDKGRTLPRWLEHSFTARSLAYLIMDDGGTKSQESKAVYINVYGLGRGEQEFLCEILGRRFKLQAKVVRDRQYCRIYISGHSYEALVALIDPYILPSLRYKIPPPRKRGEELDAAP
uniref:Putative LAGLIDADG homing endonuclease n=1 Tax=Trebouxiophyceae sp. MX-AZ01 TaxID=1208065 RepID=J7KBN7_9CHLO|nr:putative LAGLIDADG homing endonuclease [Trebouxiophyceae sp. MX-AZ01]AFQ93778.1 putative LAGLIDADG homing endonuclease [Trebouxiophyceae sp. MX-AZ01]